MKTMKVRITINNGAAIRPPLRFRSIASAELFATAAYAPAMPASIKVEAI